VSGERLAGNLSDLSLFDQSGEVPEGPIKGLFRIVGKTTGWQLPHAKMIGDAVAADAFS
jgi:hypothetical protein